MGKLVGISISLNEDLNRLGYGQEHLSAIAMRIARVIVRGGHHLAYGGDLRPGGFTYQLFDVVRSENEQDSIGGRPQRRTKVYNYLSWPFYLSLTAEHKAFFINTSEFILIEPSAAGIGGELTNPLTQPATSLSTWQTSRCLSTMRRLMTRGGAPRPNGAVKVRLGARVIIGGKINSFSGVMPGIFEEALYAFERKTPVYLVGGFGGAAGKLSDYILSRARNVPSEFEYDCFLQNPNADLLLDGYERYGQGRSGKDEPKQLYDKLVKVLKSAAPRKLELLNNGLSDKENRSLLRTEDFDEVVRLIGKGLGRA